MHMLTILSFMISIVVISNGMLHMFTSPYPEPHKILVILILHKLTLQYKFRILNLQYFVILIVQRDVVMIKL